MSSRLGQMHKVFGYHYFVTSNYFSQETLSAAIKTVVTISWLQGWEFDSKWRPKGGEIDI